MNKIVEAQRLSLNTLIRAQARELTEQLSHHRLSVFPPTAAKTFRRLTPAEAIRFLGVTESYLRQVAFEIYGPTEPGQSRRSYTLEDLAQLRREMDARGRTPGKYLPTRREAQVSPHFQARPKASEKAVFWRRSSSYRSMSGRSLASGMLGMRS